MRTLDFKGIDSPHALDGAAAMMGQMARNHKHVTERIDLLSINPGARSGMRAIYSVKLEALVKAANALAHCQREFEARCLDAMELAHGAEAECAIEYLTMNHGDRLPADDEQPGA